MILSRKPHAKSTSKTSFSLAIQTPKTSAAVAVMFTFSFSSAFADAGNAALTSAQQAEYDTVVGPSNAILNARFETAWAAIEDHAVADKTVASAVYTITTKAYAGLKDDAAAAVEKKIYDEAKANKSAAEITAMIDTNAKIIAIIDAALTDELAHAQFTIDYAKEVAKLDTVDVTAYSTEAYDADYTHQEKAAAIIAKAKTDAAAIAAGIDTDATLYNCVVAYINVNNIISDDLGTGSTAKVLKKVMLDNLFTGAYELTDIKLLKVKDADAEKAVTEATKAALKAAVARNVAQYQKAEATAGRTADAKLIAAYTEAYGVVIDERIVTEESAIALVTYFEKDGTGKYLVANYDAIQELVAFADKYKAEKDADGNLVRDAAAIDKIVKAAKKAAYADSSVVWTGLAKAKSDIEAKTILATEEGLAYAKETAKTLAKAYAADNADDYYPAELAKLNALVDEYTAKFDAATKTDAITKATTGLYAEFKTKADAIKKIEGQNGVNASLEAKTAYAAAKTAIQNYVTYYNGTLTTSADQATKTIDGSDAAVKKVLNAFYGEKGARTEAEIKALKDEVISLVEKLPTAASQSAAKKAAQDAVNALPAVITLADEAAVQAAVDAVKAYRDLSGTDLAAKYTTALEKARQDLYNAYRLDLNKKVNVVDKNDKAALKALVDEFKAAQKKNGAVEDGKCLSGTDLKTIGAYTTLQTALTNIRNTEKAAVKKAINAIPVNVTEADKATVEAARKLYDAYVKEYTDYEDEAFASNAATEFNDCYRTLALAEATLGLNAEDPAKAVEALKIKASSKATKGAMTIKWRVVGGDKSAAQGYQVMRSTKLKSGFKTMIKTTKMTYKNTKNLKKGTKYYYKVRAYAKAADGTMYYSDWSNKAYRVAK